ncbi:uncharacterized protein LY89DRAFT_589586 [Mollisia scopiformis]|uniref:Zn(2)-C6 fungal-type domain-containing protein n=1 Tax=Mollisia scopiformis TaxID=149040 RepID=A0A194X1Y3_MOLSC|nr:uncharacterized protein LY89DRAFT_589586 [Mollisia scopiformis]KUJ14208.1 hypothetical protein LY89DRAFT_589586 [Mollisia scopiformis]
MIQRRKPHHKTRNGCSECKRKRIKCDEAKPACLNCFSRSSHCVYLPPKIRALNKSLSASGESTPTSPNFVVTSQGVLHNFLGRPSQDRSLATFNKRDLELFHFFITVTSQNLSPRSEARQMWQCTIPQIAFSHDFLLHGLLAFSALHLSVQRPEEKKIMRAAAACHYDKAINTYRQAMSNVTRQNCEACFAFSTFVAIFSWVSLDYSADLFFIESAVEGTHAHIAWVNLLRGIIPLLEVSRHWLIDGGLACMLITLEYELQEEAEDLVECSAKFDDLERLWDPKQSKTSLVAFTQSQIKDLKESLRMLKDAYLMILYGGKDVDAVGLVLRWPIMASEVFIAMINLRQPEALIVLAHYCLLLGQVDDFWCMRGMSRRLLKSIHGVLGKEWENWISWPLQDLVVNELNNS